MGSYRYRSHIEGLYTLWTPYRALCTLNYPPVVPLTVAGFGVNSETVLRIQCFRVYGFRVLGLGSKSRNSTTLERLPNHTALYPTPLF